MNELIKTLQARESGLAMIMVIGFMLTMAIIVAAATAYAINVVPQTNTDSSTRPGGPLRRGSTTTSAISTRTAKLLGDHRPHEPRSEGSPSRPGLVVNNCNYGASTPIGWVAMSTSDVSNGQFHYDVDTSDMDQFTIWLSSTGRADGVNEPAGQGPALPGRSATST